MKALAITAHEVDIDLAPGAYYNIEPSETGTPAQNAAFHGLLHEYFTSGCFSYNVRTFEGLRAFIKRDLGAGFERYTRLCNSYGMPLAAPVEDWRLKSWADYTKKERRETIDRLIVEMTQAGVSSRKFEEILSSMDGIWK